MSNEVNRMKNTAAVLGTLAGFGLLDEMDGIFNRYAPSERPERSADDIAERKAKQEAKLARRAARNKK